MSTDTTKVQLLLKYTYGLVPIIAGADKFTNLLVDWTSYAPEFSPLDSGLLMSIVGIIEILAGIMVFTKPKVGSLVVTVWLAVIAVTLIVGGQFDIAVRDLVMAVGAYVLYTLTDN